MNPIVKIIVTFEYLINGWQIELVYADGSVSNYTDTQSENKHQLQDQLSDISADWLINMDEDEIDEEDFDEEYFDKEDFLDNPSAYVDEQSIIEKISKHLNVKEKDIDFEFKYSNDC